MLKIELLTPDEPIGANYDLLNFNYKLFQGHHVPDIAPPSLFKHEDTPSAQLVNFPFGKRLMHSLTSKLHNLNEVIDCTFDCKQEVTLLLNVMRRVVNDGG